MFTLLKIFNLVFYLGEGIFNLKNKLSLTILSCFLSLALIVSYTNQSKYRQIDGLFLHNLFTRSINSSQMAAAAYLANFEA